MMTRRSFLAAVLGAGLMGEFVPLRAAPTTPLALPRERAEETTRFIVFGDSGNGSMAQYELAWQMEEVRRRTGFQFAVLLGDQIYPEGNIEDVVERFVEPYFPLLNAGVKFYPVLGNHDVQTNNGEDQIRYFGMPGRWYSFQRGDIEFFMIDSNQAELIGYSFRQLKWLAAALAASSARWKIAAMHHPLYSSQREPSVWRKFVLEPLLVQFGVDFALSGHDHVYERIAPQKGVRYFVSGGGGGGIRPVRRIQYYSEYTESAHHFILFELGKRMGWFQVINLQGSVIDSGTLQPRSLFVDAV